jgi:glycosyltransferase involved in cell wall biosynthesis
VRFFVPGLAHTVTSPDYTACAYTQKTLRLCAMLRKLGHHVIHLGHEASRVDCDEHVTVTTQHDLDVTYPGFDYHMSTFRFDTQRDHAYRVFNANAIEAIRIRKQPRDFLLCGWGHGHRPIADAQSDLIVVEPGIGYSGGHFARWKCFESYAILHAYLGMERVENGGNPPNYDVVIPNHFDPSLFTFDDRKDTHFLCLGRVDLGKGVHVAIQACEAIGARLIIAGQGDLSRVGYGPGQKPIPPGVEFVGHADVEQRRKLLSKARGLFALTQYCEPFGGVAVEAMMSGTPVISTDWGAFTETNPHGITGYRVRTFEEILWAARNIGRIIPANCREWALANYSMDRVGRMYQNYFESVLDVYLGAGWYEPHPERTDLDHLTMPHPTMRRTVLREAAE